MLDSEENLHGIVFAAACDFSKKARDEFAERCRQMNVAEWQLWGKAELEDRLFRPENDHLLFAYFGFSVIIRRRSQRTDLRSRLVMKRKANRILKEHSYIPLLLRSPDAIDYPCTGKLTDFMKNPLWMVWPYRGMFHDGLKFCVGRYFAVLSDDGKSWDAAMSVNDARGGSHEDPWLGRDGRDEQRKAIHDFWLKIPEKNRAWLEIVGLVPFEHIMDIDDLGDEYVGNPHIYVPFSKGKLGPFRRFEAEVQTTIQLGERFFQPKDISDGRIEYFPKGFRERHDDVNT